MKRSVITGLGVLSAAVLAAGTGASAASASAVTGKPANVVGPVDTSQGEAGYYTQAFGVTYQRANATFDLNATAENLGDGAIGTQLCDSSDGDAAQAGVVYNGGTSGTFTVDYAVGQLTGAGTDGDPCVGNGVLSAGTTVATQLTAVPVGDSVQLQIRQYGRFIVVTAADIHDGIEVTSYSSGRIAGFSYYNEAGDGIQQDPSYVSACAVACLTDLADFTGTTATSGKYTRGLARWNAVQVDSASMGSVFASPDSTLTPSVFSKTWVKGHWTGSVKKHTHRWVRGHYRYAGLGASSFSVYTGAPTGV